MTVEAKMSGRYYEVLGVSKNASQGDLRKAYLQAAIKLHPSNPGGAAKLKQLVQAYGVLIDLEKRRIYDQYGEDALKEGMGGEDVLVEHTLSLTEALCGFQFVLTFWDGRQLLIKSNPGQVVKPNSYMAINWGGMPVYQRPFIGKLYIHFKVEFPDSLGPDQVKALEAALSPQPSSQVTDMDLD